MNRTINLNMSEKAAVARCLAEQVGVSAIESLPAGGVRLVCNSVDGAELMRRKLKSRVINDAVRRTLDDRLPPWPARTQRPA